MNILWVATSTSLETPRAIMKSVVASHRFRLGYPALFLEKEGHHSEILTLPNSLKDQNIEDFDCAVFTKITAPEWKYVSIVFDAAIREARLLKRANVRIAVDICDFQLGDDDSRSGPLKALIELADLLICNSNEMSRMIRDKIDKCPPLLVIPDPVELGRNPPAELPEIESVTRRWYAKGVWQRWLKRPDRELELLWFGHSSNLRYLEREMPQIRKLGNKIGLSLTICSGVGNDVQDMVSRIKALAGSQVNIKLEKWNPINLQACFARAHVVLIPSDPADALKRAAGSNRLLEALWAGKTVVAHPLPSYEENADYCYLTKNLAQGVEDALKNPDSAKQKILNAQSMIAQKNTVEVIGRKWQSALSRLENDKTKA